MDVVRLLLPYSFLREKVRLDWKEFAFGLSESLIDISTVKALAKQAVTERDSTPELIQLVGAHDDEHVNVCVRALADIEEPKDFGQIRDKWLYLVLAWIFEHQANYADPLQAVEEVYADFGYPEEISGLVRYMPSTDPSFLGTSELGEARLYEKWQQYLRRSSARFAPH